MFLTIVPVIQKVAHGRKTMYKNVTKNKVILETVLIHVLDR